MPFDPKQDAEFEYLAHTLAPTLRKRKKTRAEKAMDDAFESLEYEFRDQDEDEWDGDLMLRDFFSSGPGFARDFDLGFAADFKDKGDGEVSILNHRGEAGTFTRATIATTVDRNGLVKQVASGVPRSYYHPTTGEYLGYLAEGARTNLFLRSEEFDNAAWGKVNCTVTPNATTAPDGTATADRINASNATASIAQGRTLTANVPYTAAVFVKNDTSGTMEFGLWDDVGNAWRLLGRINLATGAVSTIAGAGTVRAETFDNGWFRITLETTTHASNTVYSTYLYPAIGGATSGSFYVWGAQLEAAAFASSYIPTTTASVTRNADVLTYPSSGSHNPTEGTIALDLRSGPDVAGVNTFISIHDGTANNQCALLINGGAGHQFLYQEGGTPQANIQIGGTAAHTSYKRAASYSADRFRGVVNGGAVATDDAGAVTGVVAGTISIAHAPGQTCFGTLRNVRLWKRRMPDADLQALTA